MMWERPMNDIEKMCIRNRVQEREAHYVTPLS